jgi:hypothetical protein
VVPTQDGKKWCAVRGLRNCKRFQKKENAGKVPGSNLAVNVRLTLTVPNFADASYRAADIPRLRVCYTPFLFDIGTRGTSTSHRPAVLKKSRERIGKRCVKQPMRNPRT